jgi:undecaprenyl diphosphate synthase
VNHWRRTAPFLTEENFVIQSTWQQTQDQVGDGLHVAVVMDGNGRWAEARGAVRTAGHEAGVEAARRVVEAAPDCGISVLSLYAFSSDNWQRPPREVHVLMGLAVRFLREEAARAAANGVRLEVVGRRDRLPTAVRHAVAFAEQATEGGRRLRVRVALDYSARDAILRAARRMPAGPGTRESFAALLASVDHGRPVPPVDLFIRTGGERRLSDFLLWESAYAELHFVDVPWPEFGALDLADAVAWYRGRTRRFGGLVPRHAAARAR